MRSYGAKHNMFLLLSEGRHKMPGIGQLTLLRRFNDASTEKTFHLVFNDTYEFSRKNLGKVI